MHFILSTPEVDDRSGGEKIESSQRPANASSNNALKLKITFEMAFSMFARVKYSNGDGWNITLPDVKNAFHVCQSHFQLEILKCS